ncbi:MAG: PorT family protein [Prevotellaceae bacterium]|nr:PorT family protein [Prevotellaceae bacterium]
MRTSIRLTIIALCLLPLCARLDAQERKVMTRPYIDERRFHWGFMFGMQLQDMELRNNGFIDPETGEQWYADIDSYNPGFSVGIIGEMRLNKYLALRLVPTMHFGQRHVLYHEQVSGRDTTQNLKSTYISFPVSLKMAAPRYNNFRPYVIAGLAPSIDLAGHKHQAIYTKPFDCFVEVGMGCDIYFSFFKLIPELKFSFGLLSILKKHRDDLIDGTLMKFTNSEDKAHSKMITLTFNFE